MTDEQLAIFRCQNCGEADYQGTGDMLDGIELLRCPKCEHEKRGI